MARRNKKKNILGDDLVDPADLPFHVAAADAWIEVKTRPARTGSDRNDSIISSSEATVSGGRGDDIVRGKRNDTSHASTLNGDEGNDLIIGYGGADIIDGGVGTDRVVFKVKTNSAFTFDATDGTRYAKSGTTFSEDGSGTWQRITLDGVNAHFKNIESFAIRANSGADTITTGDGDDVIRGHKGRDTLNGGGGDDILDGGLSNDTLIGGAGQDFLYGGKGHDTLNGGANEDFLRGGPGDDLMTGGSGDDTFVLSSHARLGVDIVTDWQSGSDKIQIDTTSGSETALNALLTAADIRIVTGRDYSHKSRKVGSSTNDANINDVAIAVRGGSQNPLMILEDWTGTLDITHFDVV